MLRDSTGDRLFRRVIVTIIFPDAVFPKRRIIQHAGERKGFSAENIDMLLMQIADDLDIKFPFWNFKPVELSPEGRTARYSIVFAGYRSIKTNSTTEAPILEPGTAAVNIQNDHTNAVAIPLAHE